MPTLLETRRLPMAAMSIEHRLLCSIMNGVNPIFRTMPIVNF
jgi:hypothetical protein